MISLSAAEGYRLWADTWDASLSPVVAVEERVMAPRIAALRARRVVDIGCGTGRWTARLGAIGVDASEAMLAQAANKAGMRGRLAAANATALPLATACCDAAICALTLGHVRDRAAALAEITRILAPGGTLIVSDFHPAAAARGWRRTFRRDGVVYELEHHPYGLDGLWTPGLALAGYSEAAIGEPERPLFERAGRPELFREATRAPAVMLTWWRRV